VSGLVPAWVTPDIDARLRWRDNWFADDYVGLNPVRRDPAPDGTEWVLIASDDLHDMRWLVDCEMGNPDPNRGLYYARSVVCLNPLPVPEITEGMWVESAENDIPTVIGFPAYIERPYGDDWIGHEWCGVDDGWRPLMLNGTDPGLFVECEPHPKSGTLYQLLGIEGEAS